MRVLAAPFEIANVEDRLARLQGSPAPDPFALGALATAWPGLAGALSPGELRQLLARSVWGDPGDDSHPGRADRDARGLGAPHGEERAGGGALGRESGRAAARDREAPEGARRTRLAGRS